MNDDLTLNAVQIHTVISKRKKRMESGRGKERERKKREKKTSQMYILRTNEETELIFFTLGCTSE